MFVCTFVFEEFQPPDAMTAIGIVIVHVVGSHKSMRFNRLESIKQKILVVFSL